MPTAPPAPAATRASPPRVAAPHPIVDAAVDKAATEWEVLDLTRPPTKPTPTWAVGKYDERRTGMYVHELFAATSRESDERRDVHVGVDVFAPAGTEVRAMADGVVVHSGRNPAPGDYGPVIVTRHDDADGRGAFFALWGHLSVETLRQSPRGRVFKRGEVLGWVGTEEVNGGWAPHVHFQLAWDEPPTHDMPGVVRVSDRAQALLQYPDPRGVLGLDESYRFTLQRTRKSNL